jgi:hypothetical protein
MWFGVSFNNGNIHTIIALNVLTKPSNSVKGFFLHGLLVCIAVLEMRYYRRFAR